MASTTTPFGGRGGRCAGCGGRALQRRRCRRQFRRDFSGCGFLRFRRCRLRRLGGAALRRRPLAPAAAATLAATRSAAGILPPRPELLPAPAPAAIRSRLRLRFGSRLGSRFDICSERSMSGYAGCSGSGCWLVPVARTPRASCLAPPHAVALPLAHAAIGTHRATFGNAPPQPCYLLFRGNACRRACQTNVRRSGEFCHLRALCPRCYDFLIFPTARKLL